MLDTHSVAGKEGADPLVNVDCAESFWRSLPHDDPVELQRRLCGVLAKVGDWQDPDIEQFRALRALDYQTQRLLASILFEHTVLGGHAPEVTRRRWLAGLELSRSFSNAYDHVLRVVCELAPGSVWSERTPDLVVRLFRHREVELLLTLCLYESWPRGRWKGLHDAYRFALATRAGKREVAIERRRNSRAKTVTPEQMYVRILLLQMMDGGQFMSSEIAAARLAIKGWSKLVSLVPGTADGVPTRPAEGFVVDLASGDGLKRATADLTSDHLWLDTVPIATSIDRDVDALKNAPAEGSAAISSPTRRLALLSKLKILCAPTPVRIRRRSERAAVSLMSVDVAAGDLNNIFKKLRDEARRVAERSDAPELYRDESTITDAGAAALATTMDCVEPQPWWHIRDRSDSGCRLRGRVSDLQQWAPGSLIVFRNDESVPWTLAVVRRLKKLVGNNVELGVEHLGRNPQCVVMSPVAPDTSDRVEPVDASSERFAALYLPESDSHPRIPIKTLIVLACDFNKGRVVSMQSTRREVAVRLKKPIEYQTDFVWTTFEFIDGRLAAPAGNAAAFPR
jgi:hypothetical protein